MRSNFKVFFSPPSLTMSQKKEKKQFILEAFFYHEFKKKKILKKRYQIISCDLKIYINLIYINFNTIVYKY